MDYTKYILNLQNDSYNDFKFLYDTFSGKLYGFVLGLVKSESIAKEIVQETFIKIWVNRKNIDPDLSFKAYLFKISQNLIIDNIRKQMNNPIFENYLDYCNEIPDLDNIEQKIDFDLFVQRLEIAKKKLPPRQKEIFELNKEQGIAAPEIAKQLNINEQTVYNQLSSALKILKKEIGGTFLFLFCLFMR
jgi:RNA polymerase sigma-70 factor (ECF subfamily)